MGQKWHVRRIFTRLAPLAWCIKRQDRRAGQSGHQSISSEKLKMKAMLLPLRASIILALLALAGGAGTFGTSPALPPCRSRTLGGPISTGLPMVQGAASSIALVSSPLTLTQLSRIQTRPISASTRTALSLMPIAGGEGALEDLGVWRRGASSLVAHINDRGWGIGASNTGISIRCSGLRKTKPSCGRAGG